MADHSLNKLSARGVASETKPGRYSDGGGLYLQVSKAGAKSWLFRYMLDKKARQMGLGSLKTVTLAEARDEAMDCRKLLREGIDPIDDRKTKRQMMRLESISTITFKECANQYITSHKAGWRNPKHAAQWTATLETYAYPVFGDLSVQLIDTDLVMQVLDPIWHTKSETASRVRGRIEAILDWATAREYRKGENPARWKGHISNLLPARSKVQKTKHHTALPFDEIGAFMETLRKRDSVSAKGLEFLILTAARTGEVIGATWDEIDLESNIWTIPADRMKADKEHRVPLSEEAKTILLEMKKHKVSDFIFPGSQQKRPLSNMAFLQFMKKGMKRGDLTVHGFRSTFRDWCAERTNYPNEVAEMALAHTVGDKVEAAYRRGDLFEKRRRLMRDWAQYCAVKEEKRSDKVTS
ncbi:MAG: integrase arm-type DNA-binding domain-containing protein, partial [Magnetovibrio sp.]|nr:integrase arm-type DNA-binding domain-containing protein [Magnetovibrio sp.]